MQIFQENYSNEPRPDLSQGESFEFEALESEHEREFMAKAFRVLSNNFDYSKILQRIPCLTVPDLADYCLIHILEGDRLILRSFYGLNYENFRVENEAITLKRSTVKDANWEEHLQKANFLIDLTSPLTQKLYENGARSVLSVPMIAHGHPIGLLSLFRATNRPYLDRESSFIRHLANDFGVYLKNARLYYDAKLMAKTREEAMAVISHDLKNPLTVISLQNHLISKAFRESDKQLNVEKYLACSERSIRYMEQLITDLLDFMRTQAGLPLNKEACAPNGLIENAVLNAQPLADEKGIEIFVEFEQNLQNVLCDSGRIGQALSNIIGNAIKFSPRNSVVKIQTMGAAGAVQFAISDRGPGIPPEDLPRIFEMYWQASKTAHLGSGLGLAIAHGIIVSHGGKIWAQSSPGEGTTIFLTLPY